MGTTRIVRRLDDADRRAVQALLDAPDTSGRLDDLLVADLLHGPRDGFVAVLAAGDGAPLDGYAQASMGNDGHVVGVVTAGGVHESPVRLLGELLAALPARATVTWWPAQGHSTDAGTLGFAPSRQLLEMWVPLPLAGHEVPAGVTLRAFRPGLDDDEWLAVNNAAFHWHGEQGGWTPETLQQRQREPWFRADGFLLHHRDGRLAAFCWTKLHDPTVAPDGSTTVDGEIYVIAVHPDFHGLGLGRALTVAGLQHLAAAGATHGTLYVDAANDAAIALYRSLGFSVRRTLQAYRRPAAQEPQP